jgi:[glutamine synthetase] adenylyltransferase / [glutamine synthetase]-adenylyl-L-tyrosine phosphorylase
MSSSPRHTLSEFTETRYSRLIARCREVGVALYDDAGVAEHVQRVLLASDFAYDSFQRDPELLGAEMLALMSDPRHADARPLTLAADIDEAGAMRSLRRYRRAEALRLIWRDVNGLDTIEQTLAGASALAESTLETALNVAERLLTRRHGTPRDEQGFAQRLVVVAMGKLGGGELNFSSDIDLILTYPENGQTDGDARPIANEAFFARAGQLLVKLLAEITVDGYVFRVDLRLRPFGSAGRVALSFAAMEQYYQREGRDWERYAWIKARPVAGDLAAGKRLIDAMRPFVYRRYLDYTAFAGLREMKALIDAEVARKDVAANLKLGPGGIREIEFIVQLLQLIRGGREPSLRERGLLPALATCERLGFITTCTAKRLRESYAFLRHVENRAQMLRDEQTHELPSDASLRVRVASALGYADVAAMDAAVAATRAIVAEEFGELMAPARASETSADQKPAQRYWEALAAGTAQARDLSALGFDAAEEMHASMTALIASPTVRALGSAVRAQFDRLMPLLIVDAVATAAPRECLERLLRLVHAVLRRSAYLALLDEQPAARKRLVELFADSALLAERVIAHPLLLDDLFDARIESSMPDRAALNAELERRMRHVDQNDAEAEIEVLQEEKQSASFRIGLDYRKSGAEPVATASALTGTAEVVAAHVLAMATRDTVRQHGAIGLHAGAGIALIGYGSLGGDELGFGSDLDLVFVYDGTLSQSESDGVRSIEGVRYFARIAQRVVHWLTTQTHAGKLYDVDVRLRPDGGKGLLVVSLDAFADYQRERAWVWEIQALVRARPIGGDPAIMSKFNAIRRDVLARTRDAAMVRDQVTTMRARWRAERDRSNAAMLDLKQGPGALLDIEFLLQALVLQHAHAHRRLLESGNTAALIAAAGEVGLLDSERRDALSKAHAHLLARSLDCTLDARPRLAPRDVELSAHAAAVLAVAHSFGLHFDRA